MKKVILLVLILIVLSSVALASRNAMVPPSIPGTGGTSSFETWAGLTDWFTDWFVSDGNSLSINETTLGNFVDARMIASNSNSVWNKTGVDTYYDSGDVIINNTLKVGLGSKIYYSGGELVFED